MSYLTKARLRKWWLHRKARLLKNKLPSGHSVEYDRNNIKDFDNVLSMFNDRSVFVHVGLSDVKKAFDRNPYEFLLERLSTHFDSVMAPGFTPSFRKSGVYHVEFSRPEYGTFSKLFLEDADYRTRDAIHSILVKGNFRFEDCNHQDSFGLQSCWKRFDNEDMLYLNVGTDEFVATQLHYIEVQCDLPYVSVPEHRGVVYENRRNFDCISQSNYGYEVTTTPNWKKLRLFLIDEGVITDYSLNGLRVYAFHARDLREALENKLEADPYFIIT